MTVDKLEMVVKIKEVNIVDIISAKIKLKVVMEIAGKEEIVELIEDVNIK